MGRNTAGDAPAMRWDAAAIRSGALVSLVFAVPFSIAARVAADNDDSTLATWLVLGAIVGFVIGAGCAAWLQRAGTPLSHGMVTAGGTYLAAQAAFILVRVLRSDTVNWFAVLFNLSFVLLAGLVGGLLGQRLQASGFRPSSQARRSPTGDDADPGAPS
jgi:uncharacterized membrane protein YfcA